MFIYPGTYNISKNIPLLPQTERLAHSQLVVHGAGFLETKNASSRKKFNRLVNGKHREVLPPGGLVAGALAGTSSTERTWIILPQPRNFIVTNNYVYVFW